MSTTKLPQGYSSFAELLFCSNSLRNAKTIIAIDDFPALLVGRGQAPLIWLGAPMPGKGKAWQFLVEASRSRVPNIDSDIDLVRGAVTVSAGKTVLLHAHIPDSEKCTVDALDLRPLGVIAFGDSSGLHVGTVHLVRNTFDNVETVFALSKAG